MRAEKLGTLKDLEEAIGSIDTQPQIVDPEKAVVVAETVEKDRLFASLCGLLKL